MPARAGTGPEFVLGPGDRLAVSVFKRPDLSGEFRVTPAGALALPYVQSVPVSGLSLEATRDALVQRLRQDAFLLDPRLTIELVETPPIFVSGEVSRPGSYPFQLGMTVLRAVASAGGVQTVRADNFSNSVEIGLMREKLRNAQQSLGIATVRHARLTAERADQDDFELPEGVQQFLAADKAQQAYLNERALLRQRNDAFRGQVKILTSELDGFHDETAALNEQLGAKQHEADLALEESRYIENLQRQGLTPKDTRGIALRRLAVQLDGERSQINAGLARAREEMARIAETLNANANQRQVELITSTKETEDSITTAKISIEETQALLVQARQPVPVPDGGANQVTVYMIDRTRSDPTAHIVATADTLLLPGDMIEVSQSHPATTVN